MCSKYQLTTDPETLRDYFSYWNKAEFPPRPEIRPTEPVMIIREGASNRREMALVRWGFVPHWVKDPDDFPLIINARAETLLEKPSFRTAVAHKRCIIPANGFYEWSGPKGKRQPHFIEPKTNAPLGFAGLWEHWLGPDGSEFESAAIITVAANKEVGKIHDRMPAILEADQFDDWLNVRDIRAKTALPLLKPAKEALLTIEDLEAATPRPSPKPKQGDLF
ncbi:MAG: DUF159 family protein [Rhodomicrobium sp.]|nr:MAG: DUF159 family protein [Rhodomicrobium sp.]